MFWGLCLWAGPVLEFLCFPMGTELGMELGIKLDTELSTELGTELGTEPGPDPGTELGTDMGTELGTEPSSPLEEPQLATSVPARPGPCVSYLTPCGWI